MPSVPSTSLDPPFARLAENEAVLLDVRNLVAEAVKEVDASHRPGEWLLDNFYLIEEQISPGQAAPAQRV